MPALAHLGIGFIVKRFYPKIPLWILLISSMLIDILSYILIFAPMWTHHGLFMGIIWSFIFMLIAIGVINFINSKKNATRYSKKNMIFIGLIIAFVVFSHTILDLIGWPMTVILGEEAKGIPLLFNDSQTIGLGVYSTWVGAITMDLGIFIIGFLIYYQYINKKKK